MRNEPDKTAYDAGEELDLEGLMVYRVWSNGDESEIPHNDLAIEGFDSSEAVGQQEVTVIYNGFEENFIVTIGESRFNMINWVLSSFVRTFIALLLVIGSMIGIVYVLTRLFRKKE